VAGWRLEENGTLGWMGQRRRPEGKMVTDRLAWHPMSASRPPTLHRSYSTVHWHTYGPSTDDIATSRRAGRWLSLLRSPHHKNNRHPMGCLTPLQFPTTPRRIPQATTTGWGVSRIGYGPDCLSPWRNRLGRAQHARIQAADLEREIGSGTERSVRHGPPAKDWPGKTPPFGPSF
jgi:hypothetical protein